MNTNTILVYGSFLNRPYYETKVAFSISQFSKYEKFSKSEISIIRKCDKHVILCKASIIEELKIIEANISWKYVMDKREIIKKFETEAPCKINREKFCELTGLSHEDIVWDEELSYLSYKSAVQFILHEGTILIINSKEIEKWPIIK